MATNTLLTNVEISNVALRVLSNWLVFTRSLKNNYSDAFGRGGNKIGDTYNIRKPVQYKQTSGMDFQAQGVKEDYTALVLDQWTTRGMQLTTKDLTLSVDLFEDRIIKPAVVSMANQIDEYNLAKAVAGVNSIVGTPGTEPASQNDFNKLVKDTRVRLANNLAKPGMQSLLGTPDFVGLGSVFNTNVFNPTAGVSEANTKGYLTNWGGFDWYETQILPDHVNGSFGGSGAVNGADQSGSVINTDGWSVGTSLNVGDVVTFEGVYAVNAQTKQPYSYLAQFVVTSKNPAGASQALSVYPALVADGAQQNVSALPADGADVTVVGTTGEQFKQALAFEDDAFAIAFARFDHPSANMGVDMSDSYDSDIGVGITYSKAFDIRSYAELHRLDTLHGFVVQRPELAVRTAF